MRGEEDVEELQQELDIIKDIILLIKSRASLSYLNPTARMLGDGNLYCANNGCEIMDIVLQYSLKMAKASGSNFLFPGNLSAKKWSLVDFCSHCSESKSSCPLKKYGFTHTLNFDVLCCIQAVPRQNK